MSQAFKRHTGERGNTLAEMLVYVALMTMLLFVIVQTTFSISVTSKQARLYLDINSAATSAFSRFSRDIRRAYSVDTLQSTFGSSAGKLVLRIKNTDGTNDTVAFYVSDKKVKIDQNGSYVGDITEGTVDVSNLTFKKFVSASSTAIRIDMAVAPVASSTIPVVHFYGTYVLRGSYIQ